MTPLCPTEDPGNDEDSKINKKLAPKQIFLNAFHCGKGFDDIMNEIAKQANAAIERKDTLRLAMAGYSHGGGLVYKVSEGVGSWQDSRFPAYFHGVHRRDHSASCRGE